MMGRPNVGKSTLINALLKQKVASVSPRPQTTRRRQMGILSLENSQIILVDTPGVHLPRHKLGERMNQQASDTLRESDLALMIVDVSVPPGEEDHLLAGQIAKLKRPIPTILVLNKSDLVESERLQERQGEYRRLLPEAECITISATRGDHLDSLLEAILTHLPQGNLFFPTEQITDLYEREIAADLIRESALNLLRDEVPHGIAVRIDQFIERGEQGAFIETTLFVERESHKGIVIGRGGEMLKKIGTAARLEIEAMSGRKVYLNLRVKVRKNWRDNEKLLRWFGY